MNLKLLFLSIATVSCAAASANAPFYKPSRNAARSTELAKPVALPATDVTLNGFTANWQTVENAEAYCVFAYTKQTVASDGKYAIIAEDFDAIDFGSVVDPVWSSDVYMMLDDYTNLPNWSVYGYASFAGGMVGGILYSPYLDLRNNDGQYDVEITVYATKGDEIRVESNGANGKEIKSFICEDNETYTHTLSFDNGNKDTFFSIVNMTAEETAPAYVDNVVVTQNLKKGDTIWTMVALDEDVEAPTTSTAFNDLTFANGETLLYYDLYAVAVDYTLPNGSLPYTTYYSEYSDRIEVNLDPAGVEATTDSSIRLQGLTGQMVVTVGEPTAVEIYTVAGQLVAKQICQGATSFSLPQGIYLAKAGTTTEKIIIK